MISFLKARTTACLKNSTVGLVFSSSVFLLFFTLLALLL
jgi:hypothetical protein